MNAINLVAMQSDPWAHTLSVLSRLACAPGDAPSAARTRKTASPRVDTPAPRALGARVGVAVRIVERPTPMTASIIWMDPTSCRYGEQIWRCTKARRNGVCVLSGESIRRGDEIYRPFGRRPAPANAESMMLAARVRIAPINELLAGVAI
ncbi:DUF3331 domain-containing protein [Paraburkholderia sp. J94]|uniref:DUF3331 domain-containing protein n=1 Tax=Paraburkholderia sp. J94 TaxID=2805441 RepID=UPI002AB01195|nr:DUF3331 domain-containing protein [Paraburkholderia sp. J94]